MLYNLYAYCYNNPINLTDQLGESPANIIGAIVGGAVGAVLGTLLAKELGLKGAKRAALIAAATIGGAVLGAFLGPYVAKLGSKVIAAAKTAGKKAVCKYITKVCFVKGTLVLTAQGDMPIEEIKKGDMVFSENPETGEKGLKKVVQTFVNETAELVHVYVNGEEIITTPAHPFYVLNKGWIGASDLNSGDELVLQSGKYIVVEQVCHEILDVPITVYNFEVEDFHTYYVSQNHVLVHNECAKEFVKNPKTAKEVIKYLKKQGFKVISQNGSHVKLKMGQYTATVPYHSGKNLAIGTLRNVMKQAGLL